MQEQKREVAAAVRWPGTTHVEVSTGASRTAQQLERPVTAASQRSSREHLGVLLQRCSSCTSQRVCVTVLFCSSACPSAAAQRQCHTLPLPASDCASAGPAPSGYAEAAHHLPFRRAVSAADQHGDVALGAPSVTAASH
eukprot:1051966-Rhodomonas_salina.7